MDSKEKSKRIIERLSSASGRRELGRQMMEPLSYGLSYADIEFLCECGWLGTPTGFGSCPECGFDLMLSELVPVGVIVILDEW